MREKLIKLIGQCNNNGQYTKFNIFIIAVVIFNSIILGLETIFFQKNTAVFVTLNEICLAIFVFEMLIKIVAWRTDFFKNPWNLFDLIIIIVCLIPFPQTSILRALRVLKVFRILSAFHKTKRIINALINSLPSMVSILSLLFLFFYIYSILCTHLFGKSFPEYFGSFGDSLFSLFQVMTLESWSESIVRPIMAVYPYAGVVFISFIFISSYCILNLVIGIIVTAMQEEALDNQQCLEKEANFRSETALELDEIKTKLNELTEMLKQEKNK